jgi:hypothetical protein
MSSAEGKITIGSGSRGRKKTLQNSALVCVREFRFPLSKFPFFFFPHLLRIFHFE